VEEGFLADICAHPDDVAPRLVYADWLDDRGGKGDAARAELIRLQCRPGGDKAREKELLEQWGKVWHKPFKGLFARHEYRRGFIERVTMKAKTFVEDGERILGLTPLRYVKLRDSKVHVAALAECEFLTRLDALDLNYGKLGAARAAVLLASPHLGNLRVLDLGNNNIGKSGVQVLVAAAPRLGRLRLLALDDNNLGDAGAFTLIESPLLGQLRALNLEGNDLTDATLDRLAAAPAASGLVQLHLGRNNDWVGGASDGRRSELSPEAFRRLLRSEHLGNLRKVFLDGCFAILRALDDLRREFSPRVDLDPRWDAKLEDGPAADL
jgi:uncharacterized protein (TIGR02996 family)